MRCLTFLFLILTLYSCRQNSDAGREQSTTGEEASSAMTLTPELREAYAQFRANREHLPDRQIQEAGKLYPVDEALRDTAFFVWRETLLAAVRQKDIFPLMDAMAEEIKVSFGAENGTAAFVEQWNLQSPEKTVQSPVWTYLEQVLTGGGTFSANGNRFEAPYVSATWPPDQDTHQRAVITGAGVRIREQPSLNSGIAAVASHTFVNYQQRTDQQTTIGDETYSWHRIETDNGVSGYVWGKYIGSPISYRAVFERDKTGLWQMVLFLAGD